MSDTSISEAIERLEKGGAGARQWIDRVRGSAASVANEADSLIETTRRARLSARRIGGAMDRRNCVGVFGPSQAGKSYLVSALAKRKEAPLTLDFAGVPKDFLKEINPAGGKESTGLVSRFTRYGGQTDAEFPVELRLLTETDLVKIIANSFLSDFDTNNMDVDLPDEDEIRSTLNELEASLRPGVKAAEHLDEIELFDLGEYFRLNFRNRIASLNRAGYWETAIRIGGRLALPGRARLFALLWGNLGEFTTLFELLAGALERAGNPDEVHASLDCLTPRLAGSPPRSNTIIDVALLQRLGSSDDAGDLIAMRPAAGGAIVELPRATLCALTAEVKLVMQEAPWPFMDHTDLLDFPGARSRLKLRNLDADADKGDDESKAGPKKLFLRGKIAFLFQRYTAELELTSMLLCMPPSNQEVKDLAGMVRGWIEMTHGPTPEARGRIANGLFLVLTKFDTEFTKTGGEDDASIAQKWDTRLFASFLELYGNDEWVGNWDGRPFDNTVFLRNPNIEQVQLMDYADREKLLEAGPAADSAKMIASYRQSFEASESTARHVRDRSEVWDAAMTPNDGGVAYLVARLDAVLDPGLKRRQGAEQLLEAVSRLDQALRRFHHGDSDDARRERDQRLQDIRRTLLSAVRTQDYRSFSHLLSQLMLPESDARGVFLNVAAMREEDLAAEQAGDAINEKDDPWQDDDPWAAGPEPGGAPEAGPARRRRERPEIFADRIINAWTGRLRRLQQDAVILDNLGVPADVVGELVNDMIVGADRLGLPETIAEAVRTETLSAGARWEEAADRAVRIAAYEINDYVGYLGYGDTAEAERPGFPEPPRDRARSIFTPPSSGTAIEIGSARAQTEREFFVDWGVALRQMGVENISHDSGREISDEDNRELGRIMELIDVRPALEATGGAG